MLVIAGRSISFMRTNSTSFARTRPARAAVKHSVWSQPFIVFTKNSRTRLPSTQKESLCATADHPTASKTCNYVSMCKMIFRRLSIEPP